MAQQQIYLDDISDRLNRAMHRKHEQYKNRFQILAERLNGLSPSAKLVNGFGYIAKQEEPVKSVEEIQRDDTVTIRVHDGVIETVVTDVKKGE